MFCHFADVIHYFFIFNYSDSSAASFLLLGGGGGKTPKCTDRRKKKSCICNLYVRACASEIYVFSGLKIHLQFCIHIYTINAVSSLLLLLVWCYKWQYTDKTLTLRKPMNMRASLENFCIHLVILKLLFPSIFCWYFRCILCLRNIFSGLQLYLHRAYIYNPRSFLSLFMVWNYI